MSVTFFKPRSPSLNLLSSPFGKPTHGIEQKKKKRKLETRLRTVRRCQVALAKLTFVLEKAKISAERDVDSHVSRLKLEKALKSVLREMPSGTFLLGNLKNSGWTVIGPWTATANRSSGLLLRYDRHWPSDSGPRPYDGLLPVLDSYRVPHIYWQQQKKKSMHHHLPVSVKASQRNFRGKKLDIDSSVQAKVFLRKWHPAFLA